MAIEAPISQAKPALPPRPFSLYDSLMQPLEAMSLRTLRRLLVAHAHGDVLEVGVGTGSNLPFYPTDCRLVGIDTERTALDVARRKAQRSPLPVTLLEIDAHKLSFASQSFDVAVTTLALCTVAEPSVVLGEIRRVLKTGGRLLLLEHVCSSHRWLAQLQNWLNPAWHRVVKGCNLNRHTPQTLQDAGFRAIYTRQILADFLLFGIYEA